MRHLKRRKKNSGAGSQNRTHDLLITNQPFLPTGAMLARRCGIIAQHTAQAAGSDRTFTGNASADGLRQRLNDSNPVVQRVQRPPMQTITLQGPAAALGLLAGLTIGTRHPGGALAVAVAAGRRISWRRRDWCGATCAEHRRTGSGSATELVAPVLELRSRRRSVSSAFAASRALLGDSGETFRVWWLRAGAFVGDFARRLAIEIETFAATLDGLRYLVETVCKGDAQVLAGRSRGSRRGCRVDLQRKRFAVAGMPGIGLRAFEDALPAPAARELGPACTSVLAGSGRRFLACWRVISAEPGTRVGV